VRKTTHSALDLNHTALLMQLALNVKPVGVVELVSRLRV
jgi:hypothetical protein